MTTLLTALKFLSENKFIIQNRGRYLFTAAFYKQTIGQDFGVEDCNDPVVKQTFKPSALKKDWAEQYRNFIMNSGIRQTAFDSKGNSYRVNVSTVPGKKAFQKAIEGGATEEEIMSAVKLYYQESDQYRVKIEKFMVDEMWRDMKPTQQGGSHAITTPDLA